MNLGTAQVIRADARNLPLADNSVDLVVTSPPYFALRSYQDGGEHYAGQIGSEPTPAEFVAALLDVTRECVRVLKPSGSLWVNLGDKYASYGAVGPRARAGSSTHPSTSRASAAVLDSLAAARSRPSPSWASPGATPWPASTTSA
jgi:DNA modification methylase